MTTRPILFNALMVRAILAGTKTQTRRTRGLDDVPNHAPDLYNLVRANGGFATFKGISESSPEITLRCPYGQPGDRLWVRETFSISETAPFKDGQTFKKVIYRADFKSEDDQPFFWKPSIHMFRVDSRIELEITGVRIGRLNEIAEKDSRAEGITDGGCLNCGNPEADCGCLNPMPDARDAFINLWESINGVGSWAHNPYVWVLDFKRV